MNEDAVRKRFFINGQTSAALDMHGRYLKPVYQLLEQVRAQALVQQQIEIDHEPILVSITLHGDITRKRYVGGATLRATHKGGLDEVWIDVHQHDVDTQGGGKTSENNPYLWVGVQVHPDSLAALDPSEVILAVWEPDGPHGERRGIATGHVPLRENRPVTGRFWLGEQDISTHVSRRAAWPQVYTSDNGLYFVGAYPGFGGLRAEYAPPWTLPEYLGGSPLDVSCLNGPYDPIAKEQLISLYPEVIGPRWSSVVVLDPTPWLPPSDGRSGAADILHLQQMFKAFDIAPTILPGAYVIKVGLSGLGNCRDPIKLILEVRLNKYPDLLRKRYEISIETGTNHRRLIHPYGAPTDYVHGCDFDVGNNPHWRNWWSGAVLANVLAGVFEDREPKPYYLPSHGFEPALWPANLECTPVDGTLVNVMFFALVAPPSVAWIDRPDYYTQMAAVAFYSLEAGDAAVSGTVFGTPAEYPVVASNSYWRSYGSPPQIPPGLQTIITAFAAYSIEVGVVYMLVMNSRYDNDKGRYTITRTALLAQTMATTTEYDAQIATIAANIAFPVAAQTWGSAIPGSHIRMFNKFVDLDCLRATDLAQLPSPAVEIAIPKGE